MAKSNKGRPAKVAKGERDLSSANNRNQKNKKAVTLMATDWKPWRIGQLYERPENHEDEKLMKANAAFKRLSGGKK